LRLSGLLFVLIEVHIFHLHKVGDRINAFLLAPSTNRRNVLGAAYWLVERRCLESHNLEKGNLMVKEVEGKDVAGKKTLLGIDQGRVYFGAGTLHWIGATSSALPIGSVERRCLQSHNLERGRRIHHHL